jgi:predicted transcriptional regulator
VKHTLSAIPKEFTYSLASLSNCQLVDDVMVVFSNVESMIQNAKEYVWILSNQILVSTLPYLKESLARGVAFKLILPMSVKPPKDAQEKMFNPTFLQALQNGKFETKFLEKIDVLICLSEKEVAALSFLNSESKVDYTGFQGVDDLSLKWTKALYMHYWDMSIRREPESLFPRNNY